MTWQEFWRQMATKHFVKQDETAGKWHKLQTELFLTKEQVAVTGHDALKTNDSDMRLLAVLAAMESVKLHKELVPMKNTMRQGVCHHLNLLAGDLDDNEVFWFVESPFEDQKQLFLHFNIPFNIPKR